MQALNEHTETEVEITKLKIDKLNLLKEIHVSKGIVFFFHSWDTKHLF